MMHTYIMAVFILILCFVQKSALAGFSDKFSHPMPHVRSGLQPFQRVTALSCTNGLVGHVVRGTRVCV
jgi:hypothetical protein